MSPDPVSGGSLVVDTKADWARWSYAGGTIELTEEGQVRPRLYRKNINACLDAATFSWVDKQQQTHVGGVRNAGSNLAAAARIIDGDLSTSWEPRRADGPEAWWVELDLGRMVTATSLILRFAADADPFEEFKVYTSDGTPAFVSAAVRDAPDYQTVASVTKPNQEMILEYPLRDAYNSDVPHRSVRYVYVEMTAWRDPEAHPRLAELEVMALGDNIVAGALARGGDITAYSAGGIAATLIDGDGTTFWESSRWYTFPEAHWYFHLNLGACFWVDRIVLVCYPPGILGNDVTPPIHHYLEVSDGVPQPGMAEAWEAKGPYVWFTVDQVSQNPPSGADRPFYVLSTEFTPRQVSRIYYDHLTPQGTNPGRIRVREIQAYGQGYIPSATLQSSFLDLGSALTVSSVEWVADTPPGTGVQIRTRTGNNIVKEVHYYTADGQEVRDRNGNGTSEDEYSILPPFRKGEIQEVVKVGEGWSSWSRPYLQSGGPFLSPTPRRYLQLETVLTSSDPAAAAVLDRIVIRHARALAQSVVGEIYPTEVTPGLPQDFTFYLRPTFTTGNRGFDEILIRTPSQPELVDLRVGGRTVVADSVCTGQDSLWLRFPLVRSQADPLVEVRLRCAVFLNGTPFEAIVGLSAEPGATQSVEAGEADSSVVSQRLIVGTPVQDRLVDWAASPPSLVTPNGDGQNDELVFDLLIYKLTESRPLGLRVFDLTGAQVRELRQYGANGRYRIAWDGRGQTGELVPPGLYVAQVFVDGAEHDEALTRLIAVAY